MPSPSKPVAPPELYCITDATLSGKTHEEQVREMIEGGARMIQLRDKLADDAHFRLSASICASICHWSQALFMVNDRAEIAAEVGADGVHLGQEDMTPRKARQILGEESVIGLSTHNLEQFLEALDEPVNYIAFGPIFGTRTKANADPATGLEVLREVVKRLEGDHRPLVLIGGITLENLPLAQEAAPKAFIAAISPILQGGMIVEKVREFRQAIRKGL